MKIGVVAEIKDQENRVALTPAGAADLIQAGHQVLVQGAAGRGAGFDDDCLRTCRRRNRVGASRLGPAISS